MIDSVSNLKYHLPVVCIIISDDTIDDDETFSNPLKPAHLTRSTRSFTFHCVPYHICSVSTLFLYNKRVAK